jgi:hypothetical protein
VRQQNWPNLHLPLWRYAGGGARHFLLLSDATGQLSVRLLYIAIRYLPEALRVQLGLSSRSTHAKRRLSHPAPIGALGCAIRTGAW